ncbi:hypothetical protein BJ986_002065 [Phycicoccus badiiscoriae]|uniref:Uncharacterized protein n=1 Tax=Pedococcus badiiscoriae TaxID=642776 RepID=A0A852WEZ2_9MICO|nr:hypothetical protein [Pedococcus badiiscoriae]NYG07578.1 hypothetical protein [Pedococcus badiiscoriae]
MKKMHATVLAVGLTAGAAIAAAPGAEAAGCGSYRPTLQYAYASCSGILDTGYIRVEASVCNASGCRTQFGPYVSKAGGSRSEIRVGTGYSLTNVTYRIASN